MNPALYEELTFPWKRKRAEIIFEYNIHGKMVLNFDQTPVGFTSPHKTTHTDKGSESAPITNVDAKLQITAIFYISLFVKLTCVRLSNRCH